MKCAGKAVSYKSRQFLVIFLCFYDIVTVYQERFWPSQKDYKMAKCTSLKKVYAKDRTVTKYWDPHEVTAWGIHKNYNSYRLIKVFWTIAGSCRRSVLFSIWNKNMEVSNKFTTTFASRICTLLLGKPSEFCSNRNESYRGFDQNSVECQHTTQQENTPLCWINRKLFHAVTDVKTNRIFNIVWTNQKGFF